MAEFETFSREGHSVRDRGVGGSNPLAPTTFRLPTCNELANGRVFGPAKGRLSWRPFRFLKEELAQHCPFFATRDTNDHAISLGSTAFSWPTTKGILKQTETIPHRDSIHRVCPRSRWVLTLRAL